MSFITIVIIAIGLSIDSFAASVTIGACSPNITKVHILKTAACMAFFQGLMPLLGWKIGIECMHIVEDYDHWIAFILLFIIGVKMIYEGITYSEHKECCFCPSKTLVVIGISIATSIDALAIGIGLGVLLIKIIPTISIISIITFACAAFSIITFACAALGMYFGRKIENMLQGRIMIVGGIVLIGIGARILFTHIYGIN